MIDPSYFGLIELLLFGSIAVGIGVWQLYSVNKDIARSKKDEPED
jgi:hypothetical protein